MVKEPHWKYLAGIDTGNPIALKRYMTLALFKLKGSRALTRKIKTAKATPEEQDVIDTMFHEMAGNKLLEKLTLQWAWRYDKPDVQILEATERLKRDATFYVRRPKLYKEEYKMAERAFEEEGWVYLGQVVQWKEVPAAEVKRSQRAIVKRAKKEAAKDGVEYFPDPGLEYVDSETDDQAPKDESSMNIKEDQVTEDGETEEDEADDLEEQDNEDDENYEDDDEPREKKRQRSPSYEEEDWKPVRKTSHGRNKVTTPTRQRKKPKMFVSTPVHFPGRNLPPYAAQGLIDADKGSSMSSIDPCEIVRFSGV